MPHGGCPKASVVAADLVGGQCNYKCMASEVTESLKDKNIHSFDAQIVALPQKADLGYAYRNMAILIMVFAPWIYVFLDLGYLGCIPFSLPLVQVQAAEVLSQPTSY